MSLFSQLNLRKIAKPVFRWSSIVVLSVFFVTLLFQFLLWKQYSLEATYVQLKNAFIKDSLANNLELGAICNSLEDSSCAETYFQRAIDINPNNKLALANLGLVLAKQQKWKLAEPNFKAYFSLGGSSYDVIYWFGLTRWFLEGVESGFNWILQSLKVNPTFLEAGVKSVDYLQSLNKTSLALSLIGAMTRGHPESSKYWNNFLNRKEYIQKDERASEQSEWELVSLDGAHYYLPVVLRENTRLKFFSVFDDTSFNLINTETLSELLVPIDKQQKTKVIQYNDRTINVHKVTMENVLIVGQNIGNVEFLACESCPNILGKKFLKSKDLEYWSENSINFLKISPEQ